MSFFMRDQIQQRLEKRVEALENGYRQNIGLLGAEGYGKTFLLSSFFHSCINRTHLIPVYLHAKAIDFDDLADRWIGAILSGVFLSRGVRPPDSLQSLIRAAEPILPKTIERVKSLKKMIRKDKNAAVLRELFSLSGVVSEETEKKVLFILDEFDRLESLPVPDPFSYFGREIMVQKNTLYLVASSQPERARVIFREKLSLLFSNFETIDLLPFGFKETLSFLHDRFPQIDFTYAQKSFILRMTDGHPVHLEFFSEQLQLVLLQTMRNPEDALLSTQKSAVSDEHIVAAFEQELFGFGGRSRLIFEKRIGVCSNFAKDASAYYRALMAISHGKRKVMSIAAYLEKKNTETQKILSRLAQEGLILKRGSFFIIEDHLFRYWIREVFSRCCQIMMPDTRLLSLAIKDSLRAEFQNCVNEELGDVALKVEALLKEFRNDVVELDDKRITCPQFSEVIFKPSDSKTFPIYARQGNRRWVCQIFRDVVSEDDLSLYLCEIKSHRKKFEKKILIALNGIDQNAKLIAQEAQIQLWDLRLFNQWLDLYDLPKLVLLPYQQETNAEAMGAMAQSIHTA